MRPGEARILWWFAEIEEGTPYTALFDPVCWDNHGYKLKTGHRILAQPDDRGAPELHPKAAHASASWGAAPPFAAHGGPARRLREQRLQRHA